jgi:LacI family transcriptional regulator
MNELGFVGSRAAGQLRSRRSKLIGVVVPDVGNPFWATVLRGIETFLQGSGMTMLVASTRQNKRRQKDVLNALRQQGVDGLVLAPIVDRIADWEPFSDSRFGVVTLEKPGVPSGGRWVSADNVKGARLGMSHLMEMGHRKVGLINGPSFVSWCEERGVGVNQEIVGRGFDPGDVLIQNRVEDLTVEQGIRAAKLLLQREGVTAIFCVNDMLALGALLATREFGMRVPEDVSIMGYDDVDFSRALITPLTTVRQPAYEIGVAAAQLLLEGEDADTEHHIEFEPLLIVRDSVSTPNK